jgi:hypothetical protein
MTQNRGPKGRSRRATSQGCSCSQPQASIPISGGGRLAVAHEQRPTLRVKVGLGERKRLLNAQPTTPEHNDQSTQPPTMTTITGVAHYGDDLLHGRRVGRIAHPLVAGRPAGVEPRQGRR